MTTEELYNLQTILQKLIQTGVSLEDILVNGYSGVHIEYIDKDCLIDKALTADPDNVAALYLQEKATFQYRNTQTSYVSSTGSTQIDVVKNYILNQGEKEC